MVFPCEDNYGVSCTDSLVTTARVAHNRNHRARHSRIASTSCARKDMRKDAIPHYSSAHRARKNFAELMSIVTLQRLLGCLKVHFTRLVDEFEFFYRSCRGKLVDFAQRKFGRIIVVDFCFHSAQLLFEQDLLPFLLQNEVSVLARDGCRPAVFTGDGLYFDKKFIGRIFSQGDLDMPRLIISLSFCHRFRRAVLQNFESVARLSDKCTQGYGYRQSDHSRSGYAYAHRVFQNIGTKPYLYALRSLPQQLCGFSRGQRHADRLRTAYGRHYSFFNYANNRFAFFFIDHKWF